MEVRVCKFDLDNLRVLFFGIRVFTFGGSLLVTIIICCEGKTMGEERDW